MKEKKRYEKPRIIESTKLEAIAGACSGPGGKSTSESCSLIMS
jgi:hypothetical protein